jgi:hypothetical protein
MNLKRRSKGVLEKEERRRKGEIEEVLARYGGGDAEGALLAAVECGPCVAAPSSALVAIARVAPGVGP